MRKCYLDLITTELELCATPLSRQLELTQVQLFQAMQREHSTHASQIESLQSFCHETVNIIPCECDHWGIIEYLAADKYFLS